MLCRVTALVVLAAWLAAPAYAEMPVADHLPKQALAEGQAVHIVVRQVYDGPQEFGLRSYKDLLRKTFTALGCTVTDENISGATRVTVLARGSVGPQEKRIGLPGRDFRVSGEVRITSSSGASTTQAFDATAFCVLAGTGDVKPGQLKWDSDAVSSGFGKALVERNGMLDATLLLVLDIVDHARLSQLTTSADLALSLPTIRTLGKARRQNGTPLLIAALQHQSAAVREEAARSLGQLGDRSALSALKDASRDPVNADEPRVQGAIAKAIRQLEETPAHRGK